MNQTDIDQLFGLSEAELYEQLGAELLGDGPGFGSEGRSENRRFGREWFKTKTPDIRDKICGQESVKSMLDPNVGGRAANVSAIAASIEAVAGHREAAIVAAVIILRLGLQAICGDEQP